MFEWEKKLKESQRGLNELLKSKERELSPAKSRSCRECGLPCNFASDPDMLTGCDEEYNAFEFSTRRAFNVAGDGVICEECFCR